MTVRERSGGWRIQGRSETGATSFRVGRPPVWPPRSASFNSRETINGTRGTTFVVRYGPKPHLIAKRLYAAHPSGVVRRGRLRLGQSAFSAGKATPQFDACTVRLAHRAVAKWA